MANKSMKQSEWVAKEREEHIKEAPDYENEFYEELCKRYGKVERYKFFGDTRKKSCFIQMYIPDVRCAIEFNREKRSDLSKEVLALQRERYRFIRSKHVKQFYINIATATIEDLKAQFLDMLDRFVEERRAGISVVSKKTFVARNKKTGEDIEERELLQAKGFMRQEILSRSRHCGTCSWFRDNDGVKYCLFICSTITDTTNACPHHSFSIVRQRREFNKAIRKKDAEIKEYKKRLAELTNNPDEGAKVVREARYREKREKRMMKNYNK